jgi:predicted flap endonuclease-1-like 5' DNA nuclease
VAAAFVISRLIGQEEDFDEFEDLEAGLEFQETPVEIEVPAAEGEGQTNVGATGSAATVAAVSTGAQAEQPHTITSPIGPEFISGEPAAEAPGPRLTDVSGIGPAYEARLNSAGIYTLQDLASADPNTVAEQVDISVERAMDWVNQAAQMVAGQPEGQPEGQDRSGGQGQ